MYHGITCTLYLPFQLKNNNNQVIWLLEKVKKNNAMNQGYRSFQEFLDKQQYSSHGILLYEKIFGRTFVSTGGLETTKVRDFCGDIHETVLAFNLR